MSQLINNRPPPTVDLAVDIFGYVLGHVYRMKMSNAVQWLFHILFTFNFEPSMCVRYLLTGDTAVVTNIIMVKNKILDLEAWMRTGNFTYVSAIPFARAAQLTSSVLINLPLDIVGSDMPYKFYERNDSFTSHVVKITVSQINSDLAHPMFIAMTLFDVLTFLNVPTRIVSGKIKRGNKTTQQHWLNARNFIIDVYNLTTDIDKAMFRAETAEYCGITLTECLCTGNVLQEATYLRTFMDPQKIRDTDINTYIQRLFINVCYKLYND